MRISVVSPVYNSEMSLRELVSRIDAVLDGYGESEIILVNDGSRDGSWGVVRELSEGNRRVRGINLMRNYGQHNALLCGIRAARMEVVVTLDDDFQNPPEEIPKLIDELNKGYDVVYGVPVEKAHGLFRNASSRLVRGAMRSALGVKGAQDVNAFRAFRTMIREGFARYESSSVNIDIMLSWGSSKFSSVPVRQDPRAVGVSNYNFKKLVVFAINMVTSYSVMPLKVASFMGFAFMALGAVLLVYVIARFVENGGSVPGFPFLASMISIFSGAQLFVLGIMGEYIARIFLKSLDKPVCVVRETAGYMDLNKEDGDVV